MSWLSVGVFGPLLSVWNVFILCVLFSFPFGLLSAFWWVDSVRLHVQWKVGLLLLTLGLNVYTLLVDRNHATLFGNQSYDGAVRTFQRWGLEKTVGKG